MDIKRGINNMNKNMIKLERKNVYKWMHGGDKYSFINTNLVSRVMILNNSIIISVLETDMYTANTEYNLEQLRKAGLID
jgi:hypothetical protein